MSKSSKRGDYHQTLFSEDLDRTQFEYAVHLGDTQTVRQFVERQIIPRWLTPALRYKLLCRSVSNRDRTMVALLLRLHPVLELDYKSKSLTSPLWTAVINTHGEIVRLLIDAGADLRKRLGPNSVHDPDCTILHYLVAICSHPEREQLVDLMIARRADVNAVDSTGKTPLHYAVTLNDNKIAKKLMSKGADVNARDVNGDTPLLTACKSFAKEEMVKLLIRNGADVFAVTREGCNALHLLANSGFECPDVAELLLKHEVPLYAIDNEKQYTPLHYAVTKGKENLTKLYLENGADVNGWEVCRVLPLFLAAARKSPVIIQTLIINGAEVDRKTKRGKTALHVACKNVQDKIISVLLEYGADINALDSEGATPFSLIEYKNLNRAILVMIRTIARRTALNKPTNEIDLGIIKQYPKLQEFYDDCLKEIDEMKQTKLFNDISYFSMFSKDLVRLALLLRDRRFAFPLKIKKINRLFPLYSKDFNRALYRAQLMYSDLYRNESILNSIFSNDLPYPVIREIMLGLLPPFAYA